MARFIADWMLVMCGWFLGAGYYTEDSLLAIAGVVALVGSVIAGVIDEVEHLRGP